VRHTLATRVTVALTILIVLAVIGFALAASG
jgi:hypothetical protein